MSDSESLEAKKRNRPVVGEKRSHVPNPIKKDEKILLQDGETPAKRGRGRPKGSTKKNGGTKKAGKKTANASGKGRGRPMKKKNDSSEDEIDENDENDETEENDEEENDSGSDE